MAENQEGQVKPVPLGFLNRSKDQLTAGISSPHEILMEKGLRMRLLQSMQPRRLYKAN